MLVPRARVPCRVLYTCYVPCARATCDKRARQRVSARRCTSTGTSHLTCRACSPSTLHVAARSGGTGIPWELGVGSWELLRGQADSRGLDSAEPDENRLAGRVPVPLDDRGAARAGGAAQLPRSADARVDEVLGDARHLRHRARGQLGRDPRPVQVGLRVPEPGRRLHRRPLQPPSCHRREPAGVVGRHVGDRARHDLRSAAGDARAHGDQRGLLHPRGAGAHRRLSHRAHAIPRRRPASDGHLRRRDHRRLRRLCGRSPGARLAIGVRSLRRDRHPLRRAAVPAAQERAAGRRRQSRPLVRRPPAAVRELAANPSFVLLVLYFTLPALAGWVVRDWMPAILKAEFNIGQGQAGVSATLYWQTAAIAGALVGGWLADRWMRKSPRGRIYVSAIGMSLHRPGDVRRRVRAADRPAVGGDRLSHPLRHRLGLLRLEQHADPLPDRAARAARDGLRHHEPGQHQLRRLRRLGLRRAARPARAALRHLRRLRQRRNHLDRAGAADPSAIHRAERGFLNVASGFSRKDA